MKTRFCFFALIAFLNHLQSQTSTLTTYISDLPLANLEILDDEVSSYQVFFTGENHNYISENSNIKLKMLEYLHKKAGVRNLVLELGYSRGYMLNKYINDDSGYYDLMRYTTSHYYLEMYKALRTFNQSLAPDERITVHGIDVERFADDGPILLAKLLPRDKVVPASIDFSVEVIRTYGAYSMKRYKGIVTGLDEDVEIDIENFYLRQQGFYDGKTIDTMVADYQRNKNAFRDYLGDDFALFDKVFSSVIEYRRYMGFSGMPHQYVYRERKIYDNLSVLMKENPDEKYYGQFGRCHISQTELNRECNWWAFSSVAKRLNEGSAQDKVLSIGIFYNEKKMNRYFKYENYFDDDNTNKELKKYIDIDCSNSNILSRIDTRDTGLVKHYQYIIYSNTCSSKNNKSTTNSGSEDFHEWAFMLDFAYGKAQYDLENLNVAMGANAKIFDPLLSFYSFGWSYNDYGVYTNFNFRWLTKQDASSGPVKYNLGGYSTTMNIGYMPHISKRFTFGFYGSFGLNKLRLNVQNDSAAMPFSPGFSKVSQMKYVNNGFVIGAGVDLRFALTHWLGIFARGNYLADMSKKYWKQSTGNKNITDSNSPKTSVGYYGLNLGLSFLFQY